MKTQRQNFQLMLERIRRKVEQLESKVQILKASSQSLINKMLIAKLVALLRSNNQKRKIYRKNRKKKTKIAIYRIK